MSNTRNPIADLLNLPARTQQVTFRGQKVNTAAPVWFELAGINWIVSPSGYGGCDEAMCQPFDSGPPHRFLWSLAYTRPADRKAALGRKLANDDALSTVDAEAFVDSAAMVRSVTV